MKSLLRSVRARQVAPAPPRWEVAFGREAALEVDLGCGRGRYAQERARRYPELNIVALESRRKWVEKIRRQCQRENISNLRIIHGDAAHDLPVLFSPGSVAGFTIHHPDPWWKKRHRKRRLVRPELVQLLVQLLVDDGWIYLQTDVPGLASEARRCFAARKQLYPVDALQFRQEVLGGIMSHRESKCLQLGIPLERLAYRKVAGREKS